MPFDESLLDEPAQLARRDASRLLWSLATAGAQVRRAVETAADFGAERLRTGEAPRALLVATDIAASRLLTRLAGARTPAVSWSGAELPRWAGAADALLVGSVDGRHPRLAELTAQASKRGLALAVVAPAGSQVAVAAGREPVHELPRDLHPRAARWSVLAPLLQALDILSVATVPPGLLIEVADALDGQAEACRPDSDAFTNPAKAMAAELAEAVPLIAGAGVLAAVAAREIADALQRLGGTAALAVALPDGANRAAALLAAAGAPGEDDFFRDRTDDAAAPRPRLLTVGDDGSAEDTLLGDRSDAQLRLDELAARRAAGALHELAAAHGVRASGVDVPAGEPLARFAAATAFGDYTGAYLGLGRGIDPGAQDRW